MPILCVIVMNMNAVYTDRNQWHGFLANDASGDYKGGRKLELRAGAGQNS